VTSAQFWVCLNGWVRWFTGGTATTRLCYPTIDHFLLVVQFQLVPRRNRFVQVMLFQMAFSFSGVMQRLACRFSGLRLRAVCLFQVFLATSPCTAGASSYHFASIAPPRWHFAFSQFAPVVKLGFPFLPPGLTFHRSRPPTTSAEFRALVTSDHPQPTMIKRQHYFNHEQRLA